ncbi:MAG TPA: LamG-like jellyroll fold domain-containing protein, partial [Tepidisphaeraceae bacterium]|nr:LamG-like jellyroll fold domain-containing protein [Tepidisphaeraceae bacterium]
DLRQIRPDVPQGLADALATALAKRPNERYASMAQFAKVLRVHTIPIAGSATDLGISLPPPPAIPPGSSQILVTRPDRFAFASNRPPTPFEALPSARISEPEAESAPPPPRPRAKPVWMTSWPVIAGATTLVVIGLVIAGMILLRPSPPQGLADATPANATPPAAPKPQPRPRPSAAPHVAAPVPAAASVLSARWVADDYQSGSNWVDRVHHTIADQKGSPSSANNAFHGHRGIAFNGKNQYFVLRAADYPVPDGNSMALAVVFKANASGRAGGQFWNGSGLVGADLKGTVDDWGIGWGGNAGLQVTAGAGNFPIGHDATLSSPKLQVKHTYVALFTWQFSGAQKGIGTITLYIDGELVSTQWKTSEPRTLDNGIAFGASSSTGTNPFNGQIAEIRFYRDANIDAEKVSEELLKIYTDPKKETPFSSNDAAKLFRH